MKQVTGTIVYPISISIAAILSLGSGFIFSQILPFSVKSIAVTIAGVLSLIGIGIAAKNYTGGDYDLRGTDRSTARYFGGNSTVDQHKSLGDTDKNAGLLGNEELTLNFASVALYGGLSTLIIIFLFI